jgi:hypothetical protein
VREYIPVPLKRYVVPVTEEYGVKVKLVIPGWTTMEAIYEEVTRLIDEETE